MRRGERLPDDQAEVVFSDALIEQLDAFAEADAETVLAEIVLLCADPGGKHPLRQPLAGWNTLEALQRSHRVVYRATVEDGSGLIEVLCVGPRSDDEVYDMAVALTESGLLPEDQVIDLWDALGLLDVVAEQVGLDGWDYRPEPAPQGMQKAAVAAGVIDAETAALLSKRELEAAMEGAWTEAGPDPAAAVAAALRAARDTAVFRDADALRQRALDRCGVWMRRARARCIRREGHPGPHRSRP